MERFDEVYKDGETCRHELGGVLWIDSYCAENCFSKLVSDLSSKLEELLVCWDI